MKSGGKRKGERNGHGLVYGGQRENAMKKIKELRHKAGLKQSELAERIGVSMYTVSCWERGLREPEMESIKKICGFFHISLAEYFADENVDSDTGEEQMTGDFIQQNEMLCLREALIEACQMVCSLSGSGDKYTLVTELLTRNALKLMEIGGTA